MRSRHSQEFIGICLTLTSLFPNAEFGSFRWSRVRGGDITGEESGSSADERVFAPWSALCELKQRVKLYSVFDANLPAAACQPACLSVSAELMLVFRGCCWATWQVSRRGTPPKERTCPMGKTQVRLRSKYGVKFDCSVCAILVLVQF